MQPGPGAKTKHWSIGLFSRRTGNPPDQTGRCAKPCVMPFVRIKPEADAPKNTNSTSLALRSLGPCSLTRPRLI